MKIILYQPQIPQNTGNIVRSCSVTGSQLFLVPPLGFSTSDRYLRRAGLDYWEGVQVELIDDLISFLENQTSSFYFFSSKATTKYTDIAFKEDDFLIFGSETSGLPSLFCQKWPNSFYSIPMKVDKRCLNLATSAGIVLYEAWRQQGFS